MRFKAIFIDIDDTLLDYVPCCREAFDRAMEAIESTGVKEGQVGRSEGELFEIFFAISGRLFSEAKHGLHTVAEVMELYPKEFIETIGYPDSAIEPFKHAFRAAWGETHTLVDGAKETLEALHQQGYRLFAASNSFGHLQRRRLERAGILHLFEGTFISMDIGYDKPDIRFFEHALAQVNRLGECIRPEEVLMVGDSMTTDIIGAQKAGLKTCFFNRRPEESRDPHPADYEITSIEDLLRLV